MSEVPKPYVTPDSVKAEIVAMIRAAHHPRPKAIGWYNDYIFALKGNCKWCDGGGKVKTTIGQFFPDAWGEKVNKNLKMNTVYRCPRCLGSGDEPLFERTPMDVKLED